MLHCIIFRGAIKVGVTSTNFAVCLFIKIINVIEFYFGYICNFDSVNETSVNEFIVNSIHNVTIVWIRLHVIVKRNCAPA